MKKRRFILIAIAGTLVVAAVALVLTASTPSREYAGRLAELRKQAKKLGLPETLEDVPFSANVPEQSNAAPLIDKAAREKDDAKALQLLMEASRKTACKFDWKDVQDFEAKFDELNLDRAIDLLMAPAASEFKEGKNTDARRKVHAALVVARHVSTFPAVECLAESLRLERKVYEKLALLMIDQPDHAALMPVVQSELFNPRDRRQLALSLRRFSAQGHEIATKRELDGDQKLSWLWGGSDFPGDPWGREAVEARHLEGVIDLIKDLDSAHTWPAAMRTVQAKTKEWQGDTRPISYALREASKDLSEAPRLAAENEAARRILFVAAAAFRYKQRYGRFPAESPVAGATAQDPFADKPLLYSNDANGFWITSVGPDEIPVGPAKEQGLQVGDEVVFKYTGPPLRVQ